MMDFACSILESRTGENPTDGHNLAELGFEDDGDRQLVEAILKFSRMLLQNCGNRSIYASSSHLNSLLNSTSMSLLENTLQLGSELAQRYQAAVKRTTVPSRHTMSALLTNHYNIDLDRVAQLSMPFTKTTPIPTESAQPTTPAPQNAKGKEKASFNIPTASQKSPAATVYANDLVSLVKGVAGSPRVERNGTGNLLHSESSWEEWGDVKVTYYPKVILDTDSATSTNAPRPAIASPASTGPMTPTPIRRSSNLGPHAQRTGRVSSSDDSPISLARSSAPTDDTQRPNFRVIEIPLSKIKANGIHDLLRETAPGLPPELQYELLTKLRAADALTSSPQTRRQLLAVRLLAITNLAYVHSEPTFHDNVLKQDSEEPRRLQLVYQLAELVHPPPEGDVAVPKFLQTIAFSTLDALSQHQARFTDVCAALNTNVSHGVLLYVVRKAVAEMSGEDIGSGVTEEDRWRDALFSLLSNISVMHRTGLDLVTAGLVPVLVEVLELRTSISERYYQKVLNFLDNIGYSARDALQTIINGDILDTISNLLVHEINTAAENAVSGKGMPSQYRSACLDYEIPQVQQQTIKWLFKFIHHMMTQAPGFSGNFDRLLRNLIDSSQLLHGLRRIIGSAHTFGSVVWTHAVSILNDFINNEPTSFAIIAEAGLSRGLLEAVTGTAIVMPSDSKRTKSLPHQTVTEDSPAPPSADDDDDDDSDVGDNQYEQVTERPTQTMLQTPREGPLARGILPTSETINIVPQSFGAICLNNAGMKMFQASHALESFFEIFESPPHVKCMDNNKELPGNLGASFDELVRHHPPLKSAIMNAILNMVARVAYLCKTNGEKNKTGAKLWTYDLSGKPVVADEQLKEFLDDQSSKGKGKAVNGGMDVEMEDVEFENSQISEIQFSSKPNPTADMTPYISAVSSFLAAMFGNSSVRADFTSKGGIEYLLDLDDSPCLTYEFADPRHSQNLHTIIAQLAETKPHLTVPSLLQRAQFSAAVLAPFADHEGSVPFFHPFVNREAQQNANVELLASGTDFAKALVNIQSLVLTLNSWYQSMVYNQRTSVSFSQVNLSDSYIRLVHSLGPLLAASLREEFKLNKIVPDHYKHAVRTKDSGVSEPVADIILGNELPSPPTEVNEETRATEPDNGGSTGVVANSSSKPGDSKPKSLTKFEQDSPEFKNFQTLRYLLGKMTRIITPFFQMLGRNLFTKRLDDYQKWSHTGIADALAETILQQLRRREEEHSVETFTFWIGMIHVLKEMFIESKPSKYPKPFKWNPNANTSQFHGTTTAVLRQSPLFCKHSKTVEDLTQ
jgi:E3 ubiquitin-protein ligase HUWE1